MAAVGWSATVLTPSYGALHRISDSEELDPIVAEFRGRKHRVHVFDVRGSNDEVRYIVLDHELLAPTEPGVVYHGDVPTRPYATDSNKFAFFCAAAAAWIEAQPSLPTAIHLHDWHVAVLSVLRAYDPGLDKLREIPQFFTIHNLSYQGQRPLEGDESSLEEWFPDLRYDVEPVADPGKKSVFNPMAAAIRLADRVNAVSPTYAEEIQQPSNAAKGFIGGEGLQDLLKSRADAGELIGILNGCDYDRPECRSLSWQKLLELCRQTLQGFDDTASHIALQALAKQPRRRPLHVLTSVGRIVDQKMRLFLQHTDSGATALEDILGSLGDNGVLILLGSGEARYERQLTELARKSLNLIFIRGYSEAVGDALYASGDLFLMPSSFEPCGISQMMAMRCGQPCVVHGVGGLRDTVDDGVTGFVFDGAGPRGQANDFVECVAHALRLRKEDPLHWQSICDRARAVRFDWNESAIAYIREMYEYRRS